LYLFTVKSLLIGSTLDLIMAVKHARPIRHATDIVPMMMEIKLEPVKHAVGLQVDFNNLGNLLDNLKEGLISVITKPRECEKIKSKVLAVCKRNQLTPQGKTIVILPPG
jgi:hypothetical protein